MGCVAPAVPSKLGWIPRHCWKNGVKPLLFLLFLLCCQLPPKLGETAKVYRYIDRILSLLFSLLVVLFASASETNRLGFTEFLLQWGRGGYVQKGGGQRTQ